MKNNNIPPPPPGWAIVPANDPRLDKLPCSPMFYSHEFNAWQKSVFGKNDRVRNTTRFYALPIETPATAEIPAAQPGTDPYAELKAAHAKGEVIQQVGHGSGEWFDCGAEIAWTRPPECYRIKLSGDYKGETGEANSPLFRQEGGSHYKDCTIQPVEFITANNLNFLEGCVVKRVCRHRRKNGAEDIRKAIHELELLLALEYPQP